MKIITRAIHLEGHPAHLRVDNWFPDLRLVDTASPRPIPFGLQHHDYRLVPPLNPFGAEWKRFEADVRRCLGNWPAQLEALVMHSMAGSAHRTNALVSLSIRLPDAGVRAINALAERGDQAILDELLLDYHRGTCRWLMPMTTEVAAALYRHVSMTLVEDLFGAGLAQPTGPVMTAVLVADRLDLYAYLSRLQPAEAMDDHEHWLLDGQRTTALARAALDAGAQSEWLVERLLLGANDRRTVGGPRKVEALLSILTEAERRSLPKAAATLRRACWNRGIAPPTWVLALDPGAEELAEAS